MIESASSAVSRRSGSGAVWAAFFTAVNAMSEKSKARPCECELVDMGVEGMFSSNLLVLGLGIVLGLYTMGFFKELYDISRT